MLTKIIYFVLIILLPCLIFPQDVLHLKDGSKIDCKVVSIHQETVEVIVGEDIQNEKIQKADIKVIVYENGKVEIFSSQLSKEELEKRLIENEMKVEIQKKDLGGIVVLVTLIIIALILIPAARTHEK